MGRKLVLLAAAGGVAIVGGLFLVKRGVDAAATEAVETRVEALKEHGLGYRELAVDSLKQQVVLDAVAFTPPPGAGMEGVESVAARRAVIDNLTEGAEGSFADVTFEDALVTGDDGRLQAAKVRIERLSTTRLEQLAGAPEPVEPAQIRDLAQGVEITGLAFEQDGQRVVLDRLVSRPKTAAAGCVDGFEFALEGLKVPGLVELEPDGPLAGLARSSESWAAAARADGCTDAAGKGRFAAGVTVAGVAGLLLELEGDRVAMPSAANEEGVLAAMESARVERVRLVIEDQGQLGAILDALGASMGGDRQELGGMATGMLGMFAGSLVAEQDIEVIGAFFAEPKRLELLIEAMGGPMGVMEVGEAMMAAEQPRLKVSFRP
ncbi:MAG TPA: hypothetical protein VFG43_08805 [Geminicoccaceae bacterium]|nr:hypothetical protein [Geminicoccaceae bacterium]